MFTKILLASDGSPHALRATDKAITIAKVNRDAVITIVHIVDDMPSSTDVMDAKMNPRTGETHRHERIISTQEKIKGANISFQTEHLYGAPGQTIVDYANEHNFDLVVIGSRGLNTFQEMVLGSVSHKVAKRVECPVLIVK